MKCYLLLFLLTLCLFNCDIMDIFEDRVVYDSKKAGATIKEKYDITNQIKFDTYRFKDELISDYYSLAIYKGNIYIHINGTIYIFDKQNFNKTNEIKIYFSTIPKENYFFSTNLAIIDDSHGYMVDGIWNTTDLLKIDLNTGNAVLIDDFEAIGLDKDISIDRIQSIGYDNKNDFIWFLTDDTYPKQIHFYNVSDGLFTLNSKIDETKTSLLYPRKPFIYGDTIFYTGATFDLARKERTNIGVERYSISNLENREHFINAKYLGTRTEPQNIIYDPPYVWMMVERDNQIQMLKLLPNGG